MSRERLRLGLLALTQLIVALDYNIVYVALPEIGTALGFTPQSVQWVVSAYAVGLGGLLLFGGRAVDRLGPRKLFMAGLALYAIASLAGGLASDPGVLIAARAVQGVGGALLTPATLALIYRSFAEGPARNRALGAWGLAGSAGLAAGSLLGGVLTNYLGWTWVFFVNVPLAAVCVVAALRLLPADPRRTQGSFDIAGAVLATAGSALLVLGLAAGSSAGWWSVQSTGTLLAGVAVLALLLIVEKRARDPLIPLRLVRGRSLAITMGVIAIFQSTLGGGYYILTSYLQPVLGYSALEAGLSFLPLTVVCMVAAVKLAPPLLDRWGIRTTLALSMIGAGIGIAALVAGISTDGGFWPLLPGSIIWGVSGGVAFVTLFASAGTGVAPDEQGVAAGVASTAKEIGGAMGLAVFVAIVTGTHDALRGLHTAGWVAAVLTVAGGLLAFALKPSRTVERSAESVGQAGSAG
ncbi:MFS transporter [Kribbella albertanoniae]|uniref:MFS transporter n=1 Tax=Kribbella albertanoniae TaxID=1266829 RepID=UPI00192D6E67|nr:MFS transporter [Kribbella albertanoniae]